MRILSLYLAREFLRNFFFLVLSFVSIYTLFDFMEKVDNFQEAGVPGSTMMMFFLLQVPEIVTLLLPLAILMSAVITLGMMSGRNEIVAIKAGGISLIRFTLPLLLLSIAVAMGLALLNEAVIPGTKARTNYIWEVLVQKQPGTMMHKEKFWYKGQNSFFRVGYYDGIGQTLSDVVYYRFDKEFNLKLRVDARRARYLGGRWIFFSGLIQERIPGGGYSASTFDEKTVDLPEKPSDFARLAKPSNEMTLNEMAGYLDKVEREGYDARRYRVDLHARLSYPFVCLIMALIGVPLALRGGDRGKTSLAPALIAGLAASLLYWIGFSYARSIFGYTGVLPPLLSVWIVNGIFGLAGLWLMTNIKQ